MYAVVLVGPRFGSRDELTGYSISLVSGLPAYETLGMARLAAARAGDWDCSGFSDEPWVEVREWVNGSLRKVSAPTAPVMYDDSDDIPF